MKKIIQVLFILSAFILLTGCKKSGMRPVSFGNLKFSYHSDVWELKKRTDENAPLEFTDQSGNVITINVSQESTYQHPMVMIEFLETMLSSYEYDVFLEPSEIKVNETDWYEFGYSYKDQTTVRKVYQRFYGKYYNAASISYTSTEENYDKGFEEALKLMSDIKVTDVPNEEKEAKARQFLVGEWELASDGLYSGYLVLHEDGTYEWYKDGTKDQNNMHHGTYGCDVENESLSLKQGDGVYLVLFPEELIIDGTTEKAASYKVDYIISFDQQDSDGYPMVNMSSYTLYTIIKQ